MESVLTLPLRQSHGVNRLKELRKLRNLTQDQVARKLNTTEASVSRYEKDDSRLSLPLLRRFADILGCSIAEIAGEEASSRAGQAEDAAAYGGEFAQVAGYDLRLSAGHGALISASEAPLFYQPFRLEWLRSITRAAAAQLALAIASGDSMRPAIENGDQLLIDRTQSSPKDGIYALRIFGDELVVKRLTVQPYGKHLLTISSDNPNHKTYENVDPEEIAIIGRVIWIGRQI